MQSLIDLLIVGELNSLEGMIKELVSQHPEVTDLLSNMADVQNPRAALMVKKTRQFLYPNGKHVCLVIILLILFI